MLPPTTRELVRGVEGQRTNAPSAIGSGGQCINFASGDVVDYGAGYYTPSFTSLFVVQIDAFSIVTTLSQMGWGAVSETGQQIRIETDGGFLLVRDEWNVAMSAGGTGTIQAGRVHGVVFGWDNTAGAGYVACDGRLIYAGGEGTQTWLTTQTFAIGSKRQNLTQEANAHKQYLAARWGSMLPTIAGIELSRSPYSLFSSPPQWLYTGMGSGSYTPIEVTG